MRFDVLQSGLCGDVRVLSQGSLSWLYSGIQLQDNETLGNTLRILLPLQR